jgi:hypothetical protein
VLGAVLLLVLAAVVEAFWSANAAIPSEIKYTVGVAGWIAGGGLPGLAGRGPLGPGAAGPDSDSPLAPNSADARPTDATRIAMDLSRTAADTRPRAPMESIDLGFALARTWFLPLWACWWVARGADRPC